uniref:Uncharacterized protein n=1 Tax=Dunaliella tertiolecta TaxID=3047 RepID=A0A7S3VHZ2_DUNTE
MSPSTEAAKYEPVMKMQSKAAQLREELEVLGSNPSMRRSSMHSAGPQQKRMPQRALSVRISEPGLHQAPSNRMGSPAAPYFKPHRPYANATANPSAFKSVQKLQTRHSASSTESLNAIPMLDLAPSPSSPLKLSPSKRKESPPSPCGSHASQTSNKSSKGRREVNSPQASRRSSFTKGGQLKASLAMQELNQNLTSSIHDLESTVRILKARDEETREKLEHCQASYMRREEQLNAEIADLKAQLARAQGERSKDPAAEQRFGKATQSIEELHGEVIGEIDNLLQKQALHLKHEEAASLRRFKQKLSDAEIELVELRGYCGKADAVWIERTKQLRAELESIQVEVHAHVIGSTTHIVPPLHQLFLFILSCNFPFKPLVFAS